jgi:RNA polymerase sigma-70 factor (ECF subfamily)
LSICLTGKFIHDHKQFHQSAVFQPLAEQRDRGRALKRGGGCKVISLDVEEAESRYALEPATHSSPEKLYEKSWAMTVLTRAMARLKAESASAEKQELFQHLKAYLTMEEDRRSYRDAADDTSKKLSQGLFYTTSPPACAKKCSPLIPTWH